VSVIENHRKSPKYSDDVQPPVAGLGAARMSALLTYRSRNSFEARFGRNAPDLSRRQVINGVSRPSTPGSEHFAIHNEGHKSAGSPRSSLQRASPAVDTTMSDSHNGLNGMRVSNGTNAVVKDPEFNGTTPVAIPMSATDRKKTPTYFSAQSYLRYQADKFIKRFDANCYIAVTRKLDTHDISDHCEDPDSTDPLYDALRLIHQPTLVLGIESDGLFTFTEQELIAQGIPNSRLEKINSPEGHDAFLLQFEQVNKYILDFLTEVLPDIMMRESANIFSLDGTTDSAVSKMTKTSTFGEAEVEDITAW